MRARLLLAVALGGAVGAVARALLGLALPSSATGFPWTTFSINVVGCFLIGLLPALEVVRRSEILVATLGPGVLGGFTTLSAGAEESRTLLASDRPGMALVYLLATLGAALLAVAVASRVAAGGDSPRPEGVAS
ncbi:MAG: CrcB family protein [Nocardioides sp.]